MDQNEVTGYNDACSNFLYLLRDDMNWLNQMHLWKKNNSWDLCGITAADALG